MVEVQSARTPTLRHVPAAARRSWCQAFTRALAAEAHRNDLRSWVELLMLPQAVLCPPPRRGRKHLKAAAAFTLDRLHRWQQGDRAQLWDSRPVPRARRSGAPSAAGKRESATALGHEASTGRLARHCFLRNFSHNRRRLRVHWTPCIRLRPRPLRPACRSCPWPRNWPMSWWLAASESSRHTRPLAQQAFACSTCEKHVWLGVLTLWWPSWQRSSTFSPKA